MCSDDMYDIKVTTCLGSDVSNGNRDAAGAKLTNRLAAYVGLKNGDELVDRLDCPVAKGRRRRSSRKT